MDFHVSTKMLVAAFVAMVMFTVSEASTCFRCSTVSVTGLPVDMAAGCADTFDETAMQPYSMKCEHGAKDGCMKFEFEFNGEHHVYRECKQAGCDDGTLDLSAAEGFGFSDVKYHCCTGNKCNGADGASRASLAVMAAAWGLVTLVTRG